MVYLVAAASLTRPTAVMSFLKSFSLQGDFLCLSWEGVVSLDCGALRGFRDKVRGSTNPICTITSTIGNHFSDPQKLLHGVDQREPDLITDLGRWANRYLSPIQPWCR